jgi:hypothetical protein
MCCGSWWGASGSDPRFQRAIWIPCRIVCPMWVPIKMGPKNRQIKSSDLSWIPFMDSNSDPLTPYYISLVGFSIWFLPAQRFACRIQTHAYWPSPSPLRWCLRGCLSGPKNTDCFGDELSVDELIVCLGCSGFPSIRACHLVSPQHPEPEPQKHLLETSMNLDLLKNSAQFYFFFRENDISTESQPWDLGISKASTTNSLRSLPRANQRLARGPWPQLWLGPGAKR